MLKHENTKTKSRSSSHPELVALGSILALTLLSGAVLTSSRVNADNDTVVDDISIEVPVSCSMGGTGTNTHNATLINGTYSGGTEEYANGIGSTTLTTFCNDNNGFSIYAIGYTNNEAGNNTLKGANTNITIPTGLYTSGTTTNSTWSMKITKGTDSGDTQEHPLTIDNNFDNFHTVPGEQEGYTRVAHKGAATDMSGTPSGATLTTTYDAYISTAQAADTYTGQVKYVMVHPYDHTTPVIADAVILDTGKTVNSKLKSVAATVVNGEETVITPTFDPETEDWDYANDAYIKSISVHTSTPAPAGFTPTEMNTISSAASTKPIYVIFDNTNDAGIMHFYTESSQIILSPDSSFMFYLTGNLSDLSAVSDWDTTNVTDMSHMFESAGHSATTFTLNLSSWNTDNVTDMSYMFADAGSSATTWSVTIPQTNGSSISNTTTEFYGQNTSVYGEPDSGKSFTLVDDNSGEEPEGS